LKFTEKPCAQGSCSVHVTLQSWCS